ncbi:thioesterase family protein [Diaphorobacter ruginosibacter]|uniref:thioesterase family protein n=1 Tax=Diaphorobacter ruginosibacter TaxID=1715720 RepID=UPI003340C9A6
MDSDLQLSPAPAGFEPEFIDALTDIFERQIAFNQVIGIEITRIAPDCVEASIGMKPELVGHFAYNRVHGGVISAALDAMAGLAVMAAIGARHMDEPPARRLQRFARLGTIDLRIDYLRPAIGPRFRQRAQVLRLGSRVATARMEFLSARDELLSVGTASYIVS